MSDQTGKLISRGRKISILFYSGFPEKLHDALVQVEILQAFEQVRVPAPVCTNQTRILNIYSITVFKALEQVRVLQLSVSTKLEYRVHAS